MFKVGEVAGILAAAVALWSTSASAAITVYTDRAAFQAAVSGSATEGFGTSVAGGFNCSTSTYNGSGFNLTTLKSAFCLFAEETTPNFDFNSGNVVAVYDLNTVITPGGDVRAIGFDFGLPNNFRGDGPITINGATYNPPAQPAFGFYGITSDQAIAPIAFQTSNGNGVIDNVVTSQTLAAAPGAPAPLLGLGLGPALAAAGGLVIGRRRRRSAA